MLRIQVERVENTAVLHCVGRIVVGTELSELREAVLCQLECQSIVLDLAGVDRVDAGGLGLLVFLHICTNGLGTELRLLAPTAPVANVLQMTHLNSVFTISPAGETGTPLAPPPQESPWEACA